MDVRLIRAFIASPGGLRAEREAAHAVAKQVNRAVALELGGRLELIGWEETLSGSGRPQALINADMETCDLFIGAMWTRWGSRPSDQGPYSSGFEEEFELSRTRYAATGSPTMGMFFKQVDQPQLDDPGDDLKKVLEFQERLRREREFLYDTFSTTEQFAEKVRDFLTAHTIRLLHHPEALRESKAQAERIVLPEGQSDGEAVQDEPLTDVAEARFLGSAAEALGAQQELSSAEIARTRLIAIVSGGPENDKLLLGPHDANLLYHEREAFDFSFGEKRGLASAGLAELTHENVPVWSWLVELMEHRPELLTALTILGEEASRVGALTAMRLLGQLIHAPEFVTGDPVSRFWLGEQTGLPVKVSALRYLRELGNADHLPAIEAEMERGATETLRLAQEAALDIHLRSDSAGAARYLLTLSFETLDPALLARAVELLDELGTDALAAGLDHRSPEVRARTLDLLSRRGALNLSTIDRAKEDDAASVRFAALNALEPLGQPISLDEAKKILIKPTRANGILGLYSPPPEIGAVRLFQRYRERRFAVMPVTAVEALLADPEHREAAYLALAARRVGDYRTKLRSDLWDGFSSYVAKHWPDGIREYRNSLARGLLFVGTRDPLEEKRRELTRAALESVAKQRDEEDLQLVRHVLGSELVAPTSATISYLRALGSVEDITLLGKTSRGGNWLDPPGEPTAFEEAARAILRLNPGVVDELLTGSLPATMRAELIALMPGSDFAKLPDLTVLNLLLSDVEELRRSSAMKVPASLPRSRVRKLLARYRENDEGRFYVVTHWLDLGLAFTRAQARRVAISKSDR